MHTNTHSTHSAVEVIASKKFKSLRSHVIVVQSDAPPHNAAPSGVDAHRNIRDNALCKSGMPLCIKQII